MNIEIFIPSSFLSLIRTSLDISRSINDIKNIIKTIPKYFDYTKLHMQYFNLSFSKIPNVEDIDIELKNDVYKIMIYIKEGDWELEDKIYSKYSELLSELPTTNFEVRVLELFDRNIENVRKFIWE